jgi:hypothetical protein
LKTHIIAPALLATLVALPATAQEDCPQERAIYTEKDNGYVLTFRTPEPWEASANTLAILDLAFPDETHIWGHIWIPNGTSHNKIEFFTGDCELPKFTPGIDIDPTDGSTQEELEACSVWSGVILALANDDIAGLPWFDSAGAAKTVLLPNIGPTIRYSGLVLSPGDEPHDVFTFKRCGP